MVKFIEKGMLKVKDFFYGLKHIEAIKAQYYAKGQEEASARFLVHQKAMSKKIEELIEQNNSMERQFRTLADQRIEKMSQMYEERCTTCRKTLEERCAACRRNLEDERIRLIRRQNILAKKISDFEEVWMKMYNHANTIIDEHDVLLRSSGRLIASRNILISFKKQVDQILKDAEPLLSIEMHDGTADKYLHEDAYIDSLLEKSQPQSETIKHSSQHSDKTGGKKSDSKK